MNFLKNSSSISLPYIFFPLLTYSLKSITSFFNSLSLLSISSLSLSLSLTIPSNLFIFSSRFPSSH